VTGPEFNTTALSNMPPERQDGCINIFAPTALCAWTFDAFDCVRRTTSRGVLTELYVPKESTNVNHIPELAGAVLKIVGFEESWCGPSLPPDRPQVAFVSCFHFSAMQNCGLIIVSESSLAKCVPAMRHMTPIAMPEGPFTGKTFSPQ
jgi:hypothetical protein